VNNQTRLVLTKRKANHQIMNRDPGKDGPHLPVRFKRDGNIVVVSYYEDEDGELTDLIVECGCGKYSFIGIDQNKQLVDLYCPDCKPD